VIKSVPSKHYPNLTKVYPRADYSGKCVRISIFSETGLKPLAGPDNNVGKTNHESTYKQYQRSFKRTGEGRGLSSLTLPISIKRSTWSKIFGLLNFTNIYETFITKQRQKLSRALLMKYCRWLRWELYCSKDGQHLSFRPGI
jgi:hypothetical protein